MPLKKSEAFTFGGCDSRSNPANFPADRALRCLNWTPQHSGTLRLRNGYTVPPGPTEDNIPIHSLIYYEQFSAQYLGPQYVMYGKTDNIYLLNIQTGQISQAFTNRRLEPPTGLVAADGGSGPGFSFPATYYYVITAIDDSGGETTISNEVSIAVSIGHRVRLTWDADVGAAGYRIYRGAASGAETLLLGTGLPIPVGTNTWLDDNTASPNGSAPIIHIVADGGGSNLATISLIGFLSNLFTIGQQVRISGSDNQFFNTIATIVDIPDAFQLRVSAPVFALAGSSGTASQTLSPAVLENDGVGVFGPGIAWDIPGTTFPTPPASVSLVDESHSEYITAKRFGFNIPDVPILGVQVNTVRGSEAPLYTLDVSDMLVLAGTRQGNDEANYLSWTGPQVFGGQNDTWGLDLQASDVNNPEFGFSQLVSLGNYLLNPRAFFSSLTMTVFYAAGNVPLSGNGGGLSNPSNSPPIINTTQITASNQMGSANPWGHFRAGNRVFLSTGAHWNGRFFNGDAVSWDGQQIRPLGLPGLDAFSNATGGPITANVQENSQGSFVPTQLTGYQFYGAIYNPNTGHMGNRFPLGDRVTVGDTTSMAIFAGLPNQYFTASFADPYPEWVVAVGMTQDGGQIPYWLTDANGNNIVFGNTATNGTVLIGNINLLQELPLRNNLPPAFDKFARVGTRIFAGLAGTPYLYYSNDLTDVTNANYVGNPEESWPPDQAEPLPSGEEPTAIHAYRLEGWFFSRTQLAIWSQFLQQQGVNPWRGPWPGGCPSQRGFVETPYGPFWISSEKELCTFMEDGVISVSNEYEASLLSKISHMNISKVEVGYQLDPTQLNDMIVIKGLDKDNNTVIVIHDFELEDERSPIGQGYTYQYSGLDVQTFAGAGFTPRFNVYDTSGKQRLWAGSRQGFIAQLEDGTSDNGASYSADYIGLISLGPNRPLLAEIEYQGDDQIQWSYLTDYAQGLDGFTPVNQDLIPGESSRWGVKLSGEGRWMYWRAQLTSHPADGDFKLTDPPFMPLPTYGSINEATLKLGRERPEGR